MEYKKDGVSLRFSQDVLYETGGKWVRLAVQGDYGEDDHVAVHVSSVWESHGLKMRMRVWGKGEEKKRV